MFFIKNVNTSTWIWGSYPLNLEHGKYCIRRLSTQHRKNRIYYFLRPGDNCCHLRMQTYQHWFESTQHRKNRIYYFLWPDDNCSHLRMSTCQRWFGGRTPWTLSIENGVKADCQRSIAKSGYTCFLLGVNCCQWTLATHQHWFGGHTLWTLNMTNIDQADCQRCIAI